MPRPCVEVTTPMPSAISRATAAVAPRAPPPSQSSGRFAAASRSASVSTARASGCNATTGSGSRSAGSSISAPWISIGTSTLTGPDGALKLACTACLNVASAVSALRTRQACFDTARSIVNWSGASWMYARSRSRYGTSIWPVMCSSGVPAVSASTIAPAALPAAVPVLVMHTPSVPVVRAQASAMFAAPASPRAITKRILPRCAIASRIGML